MKYLITGGCGFLGSNLAQEVMTKKEELCVFDNLSRLGSSVNLEWLKTQGEFSFVHGDIRCFDDISRIIADYKPDVIFHLAGQVAMTTSIERPDFDFSINALGSINVLESVRKFSPQTIIVYSSTNKVYGDLAWVKYLEDETRYVAQDFPQGFDENTKIEFHSPYGCSKGSADQYMIDYARLYGIKTVVFRHSSMYGGRQFATCDQGWVGWFCKQALLQKRGTTKELFTISGNGKQVRDLLHADDMRRLYFSVTDNIDKAKGHVFNVGGGMKNSLSLLELFEILEVRLSVSLNYTKLPERFSDQKVFVADIAKASKFLNWQPSVSAGAGVDLMLEWLGE